MSPLSRAVALAWLCLAPALAAPADSARRLVDTLLGNDPIAQVALDPEFDAWKATRVAWLGAQMREHCARQPASAPVEIGAAAAGAVFDRYFALDIAEWHQLTGLDRLADTLHERFGAEEIERAWAYASSRDGAVAVDAWRRYQKTRLLGRFDDLLLRAMLAGRLRSTSGAAEHEALEALLDAHQARASREYLATIAAGSGEPVARIDWMQFIDRFSMVHRKHAEAALQRLDLSSWRPLEAFASLGQTMTEACLPR